MHLRGLQKNLSLATNNYATIMCGVCGRRKVILIEFSLLSRVPAYSEKLLLPANRAAERHCITIVTLQKLITIEPSAVYRYMVKEIM